MIKDDEYERLTACGPERHDRIRNDPALFEALTMPDKKIQYEGKFPMLVMSQCKECGTTIARPHSDEATRRLYETMEETEIRLCRESRYAK